MNFSPYPFEPTNLSAIGMLEDDMECRVRRMVDELKQYGLCVPAYLVTEKLAEYNIPYELLPPHMINIIDELDVY